MCLVVFLPLFFLLFVLNSAKIPLQHYRRGSFDQDVTFYLYHRKNFKIADQIFINNDLSLNASRFDSYLPTKFIIHGWTHRKDVPWLMEMREALAATGSWNVIVLDWYPIARSFYGEACDYTRLVGLQLSKFCVFLEKHKYVPPASIHFIGHSLGAQIAGYAGYYIKRTLGKPVGRITGLDPAAPMFEWPYRKGPYERLDRSDATFVDVIHTNGRSLGVMDPVGHIDFYPNGGQRQPGCKLWLCSHMRSVEFYTASIKNPDLFKAYHYKSWKRYLANKKYLYLAKIYPMGISVNADMPRGLYFLETVQEEPYVRTNTKLINDLS